MNLTTGRTVPFISKLPLQPITLVAGLAIAIGVVVATETRTQTAAPVAPVAPAVQAPVSAVLPEGPPSAREDRHVLMIVGSEDQAAMLARQIAAEQHFVADMPGSTLAGTRYTFWVIDSEEREQALRTIYADMAHAPDLHGAFPNGEIVDLRGR